MEHGQSLATAPLFDKNNYVFFGKTRAFLYFIDDSVWTSVEEGWVALNKPKAGGISLPKIFLMLTTNL